MVASKTIQERPEEASRLLLEGHYTEPGESLILLIRRFDRGSFLSVDDEHFEKLTVEIRKYEVGVPIKVDSSDVRLYYSRGGSAWIQKGNGIYSSKGIGEIIIESQSEHTLKVNVDLVVFARQAKTSTPLNKDEVVEIRQKGRYTLKEISIEQLTPWLGMRHSSVFDEVYP